MRFNTYCCFILTLIISSAIHSSASADEKGRIRKIKQMMVNDAYTPKVLGMFIGIDKYRDPLWHDLKYPVKDAKDMAAFFKSSDALRLDYRMVLVDPVKTTRDHILNHALDEFEMKNSLDTDMVIVYVSGHGTMTHETVQKGKEKKAVYRPYIVTSDTVTGRIEDSAIALDKITNWFDKLRSRRKILILDLCHSGLGKSHLSPEVNEIKRSEKGLRYTPMEDSWASIILSACSMGGTSFEDDKLKNSVYTHFLLEGMAHGDLNGDGAVTISEAHNYAIDKTRQYTWEHKAVKQVPTAYSKILGKDPIIVKGKPSTSGAPVLFSFNSVNSGIEVYVDKIYSGMFPKGLKIEPGEHKIECRYQGRTLLNEDVDAVPGHEYMIPQLTDFEKLSCTSILADVGYRSFTGADVSKKLLSDTATVGMSLYYLPHHESLLAYSAGMDYSGGSSLNQISARVGIKYTRLLKNCRLYVGTDILGLMLKYSADKIDGSHVDRTMNFLCPGVDALLSYEPLPNLILSARIGAYLFPYTKDSEKKNMMMNQMGLSVGYVF